MPSIDSEERRSRQDYHATIPFVNEETSNHNRRSQQGRRLQGWLAVSPYTHKLHLLDLSTTGHAQGLLAQALTLLTPICEDYATAAYIKCFNWHEVMQALKALIVATDFHWDSRIFFIVIFRSQVKPETDRSHLADLDRKSHAEAMESGGLLKYWFGIPDSNHRNLATCVWDRFKDAQRGGKGEGHREAAKATANLYSEWRVERLGLQISEHADSWAITEWKA